MNTLDEYLCVDCKCGWSYNSLRQMMDCYKCAEEEELLMLEEEE